MKISELIIIIGIAMFILYFLIVWLIVGISDSKCENICKEKGALDYRWNAGGGFSQDLDICTCFFKDSTKTFKMEEIK